LSDVSANEIAAGFGYTAGGVACTATIARVGATTTFSLTDGLWTASGGSIPVWRYAVIYASVTRNGVTNPLVSYILGDTTPADIPATVNGATLRVRINTSGLFTSP
jgi:hypothetical protein